MLKEGRMLSARKAAVKLGVSGVYMLQLLETGTVKGYNFALKGAKRAVWKVDPKDLEEFIRQRRTGEEQPEKEKCLE